MDFHAYVHSVSLGLYASALASQMPHNHYNHYMINFVKLAFMAGISGNIFSVFYTLLSAVDQPHGNDYYCDLVEFMSYSAV